VPYKGEDSLDFSILEENLIEVLKNFAKKHTTLKELKFEPGRYIPCESGFILGRVTAIKHENNIYWIGTDIGMNQLVRPSMYDAYHEIEIIGNNNSIEVEANICGNICESGDILAKHRKIKLPNVGDIILVYNAGAYGYSMASNYTGRLRPAEVMISNNHDRLIRKRETIDYIESNIIWD
jgi:diaminopimelate decarboxylase